MKLIHPEPESSALGKQQDMFEELMEMGDCHASLDQYEQAERCYRHAALLSPNAPQPYVGLGVVAMQASLYDKATRAFQTARTVQPDCAEAYAGLAMIHQELKRYPQAFEMYLRCLEINHDNLMALLGLFQASCQMGTFSKIIHYLEAFLEKHPEDHSVLFCLATLYARDSQLLQAKQALLTILAAEPNKIEAKELLSNVEELLQLQRKQEVA